jgi:hypothetical protein
VAGTSDRSSGWPSNTTAADEQRLSSSQRSGTTLAPPAVAASAKEMRAVRGSTTSPRPALPTGKMASAPEGEVLRGDSVFASVTACGCIYLHIHAFPLSLYSRVAQGRRGSAQRCKEDAQIEAQTLPSACAACCSAAAAAGRL